MTALPLAQLRESSSLRPDGSFDQTSREVTGPLAVVEHVLRSLVTPRGSLSWAKDRGINILALELADLSPPDQARWERAIAAEARRNDYVRYAVAKLNLSPITGWTLSVEILLVDGKTYPFQVKISEAVAAFRKGTT